MFSLRSLYIAALSFIVIVQATLPSSTPSSCTAACPISDAAGFPLGQSSSDGTKWFCSYPSYPGENPNDFYCKYEISTGARTQDHDAGFCPSAAPMSCNTRR
ncbi:hypothetical protein B0H12DRAFT_959496, partial [Mycena haematopus]